MYGQLFQHIQAYHAVLNGKSAGIWCQRKGSAKSTYPTSHLLCLQAIHQWFHRYVPRHDFVSRVDNGISDRTSCSRDLTVTALLAHMDALHTQELTWSLWNPPIELVSEITSTFRRTTSPRDSLLADPPLPMGTGKSDLSSVKTWPSNPC